MTAEKQAKLLIEKTQGVGVSQKVSTVATRMLLQIFSVPSLQAYMSDFGIVETPEGKVQFQFDFLRLPEEILPQLERLLSVDWFDSFLFKKYVKDGAAHTGLVVQFAPDNIPGDAYDYAM